MQHEETMGEGGEELMGDACEGGDKQKHVARWTETEREGGKARKV